MWKKKAGILICMLLVLPIFSCVSAFAQQDEILDQSVTGDYGCGISNNYLAQSFTSKLPVLSKVELQLFKDENITGNITISIRERLKGEDLVLKTVSTEDISYLTDWTPND